MSAATTTYTRMNEIADEIAFTLLGPVGATVGARPVAVADRRQRIVLALLVLAKGRVVPTATLVDAVWGDRPPLSARTLVLLSVRSLRKAFRAAGHTRPLIVGGPAGYRLRTECAASDVHAFDALVAAAEEAATRGAADDASTLYAGALELWRGPAIDGVGGRVTEALAARLEERRTAVCHALLGLGEAQSAAGFVDEAEASLLPALRAAEALGDLLLIAEANLALGRLCRTFRRTARADHHLAAARRAFRRAGSEAGELMALEECAGEGETAPALDLIPRQGGRPWRGMPDPWRGAPGSDA